MINLAGATAIVSNDGPAALFTALTLPILGRLTDCGEVEDIVQDDNTRAIERAFGCPVSEFVRSIIGGGRTAPAFRSPSAAERAAWEQMGIGRRVEAVTCSENPGIAMVGKITADLGDAWEVTSRESPVWTFSKTSSLCTTESWMLRRKEHDYCPDVPFEEPVGGCYVHGRIYNQMSLGMIDEGGRDGWSAWTSAYLYPDVLAVMGFEKMSETSSDSRFKVQWKHPKYPKVTLLSDDTWCRVQVDGDKKATADGQHIFHPRELAQLLARHGGGPASFSRRAANRLRGTAANQFEFFKNLAKIRSWREMRDSHMKYGIGHPDYLYTGGGNMFSYGLDPSFPDRFWPELDKEYLMADTVSYWTFMQNMGSANKLLLPSYNGPQCGNHRAHESLTKLTLDILENKNKRRR